MSAILEALIAISAAGMAAILNTLWLAFLLAIVMWLALRLLPHMNGATRHAAWWTVVVVLLLMSFAALPHQPAPTVRSTASTEEPIRRPVASTSMLRPQLPSSTRSAVPPLASIGQHARHSRVSAVPHILIPIELNPGKMPTVLLLLWIAVSSVLLGRIARSYLLLRSLRNHARPASSNLVVRFEAHLRDSRMSRTPQLLVSDEVISPLVAGFLHPVVILPSFLLAEISETELDYVLLHELAHVARRDVWTNLIARLAFAVFVFHPVADWLLSRNEREREIACDDGVVAATDSAFKYAATLARLFEFCQERRPELLATGMAHRSTNLGERIEILVKPRFECSPGASLLRVSLCIGACLALLVSGIRIPGWIALAKSATVAIAHDHAIPQSEIGGFRTSLATNSPAIAAVPLVATLSPTHSVIQSVTPPATQTDEDKTWRHEWKLTREDSNSNKVRLSLILRNDDGNDRMNTEDVPLSRLAGFSLSMLDHDVPLNFEYARDAGSIVCEGRVASGRASGPFTVTLNSSFVSALQKMGYVAPQDEEAFSLVTSDVTLGYAQAVRDAGGTSSISDLIELRDHGVKPDYLKGIKAVDARLSIDAIVGLFDHGVKPEYYKAMKTSAPQLSVEDVDSLFDHGVQPESYKAFASADPRLSIEEIDSLFDHGVTPDSYKAFASVDSKLTIEEIDSLFGHGVKPGYYRTMKAVDPNLQIEQIDGLFDHGVRADSFKGFASVDRKLSIEDIERLCDHGVSPDFYQAVKAADSTLSADQVNRLRDHGVEPEYLKELRALPDGFSIADISELRDHGISAKYIRDLHDMGMKNLTASQIVHLREGN